MSTEIFILILVVSYTAFGAILRSLEASAKEWRFWLLLALMVLTNLSAYLIGKSGIA